MHTLSHDDMSQKELINCKDCRTTICKNLYSRNDSLCCSCSSRGQVLNVDNFCSECKNAFFVGLRGMDYPKY
jgi:hypothetical protein